MSIGSIGEVVQAQCGVVFTLRETGCERPALYMLSTCEPASAEPSAEQSIVGPRSYGEHAVRDYIFASPDGHVIAFGISASGDERAVLRVYEVGVPGWRWQVAQRQAQPSQMEQRRVAARRFRLLLRPGSIINAPRF